MVTFGWEAPHWLPIPFLPFYLYKRENLAKPVIAMKKKVKAAVTDRLVNHNGFCFIALQMKWQKPL